MKNKNKQQIFIVQDMDGNICGVYEGLTEAAKHFEELYNESVEMLEVFFPDLAGDEDELFEDCTTQPTLTVWALGDDWINSFFKPEEVKELMESREDD